MTYYKYPRTPHLPFSETITGGDKKLPSDEHFYNMNQVVVTIKMDGENTTVYQDGKCHARSIDSMHKDYHSWLMQYIQTWCYNLPDKYYRVCGEYLYAMHSIPYYNLKNYFQVFSIWKDINCLSWNETIDLVNQLGLDTVPIVYVGKYDTNKIKQLAKQTIADGHEGIVVRNYEGFSIDKFSDNIAKYVRPNHVQTDIHWSQGKITPNRLLKD